MGTALSNSNTAWQSNDSNYWIIVVVLQKKKPAFEKATWPACNYGHLKNTQLFIPFHCCMHASLLTANLVQGETLRSF